MLLWLLAAGLGAGIESGLAWVAVLALLGTFLLLHAVLGLPREADRDRLRGWSTPGFVRFGVPISVLLVIGDVFWLIARSQLDVESEPALPPMMPAIVLLFPLVEEFGFRLWMQTPLEERVGPLFGVGIVALGLGSRQQRGDLGSGVVGAELESGGGPRRDLVFETAGTGDSVNGHAPAIRIATPWSPDFARIWGFQRPRSRRDPGLQARTSPPWAPHV